MSSKNDDIRFLKRAWNELSAPRPFRNLEDEDLQTRAAVGWLQSAYRTASPSVASPTARHSKRIQQFVAVAVAASVMFLTLRGIWMLPSTQTLEIVQSPTPVYDAQSGQLELRSGPVRLLFLDQPK